MAQMNSFGSFKTRHTFVEVDGGLQLEGTDFKLNTEQINYIQRLLEAKSVDIDSSGGIVKVIENLWSDFAEGIKKWGRKPQPYELPGYVVYLDQFDTKNNFLKLEDTKQQFIGGLPVKMTEQFLGYFGLDSGNRLSFKLGKTTIVDDLDLVEIMKSIKNKHKGPESVEEIFFIVIETRLQNLINIWDIRKEVSLFISHLYNQGWKEFSSSIIEGVKAAIVNETVNCLMNISSVDIIKETTANYELGEFIEDEDDPIFRQLEVIGERRGYLGFFQWYRFQVSELKDGTNDLGSSRTNKHIAEHARMLEKIDEQLAHDFVKAQVECALVRTGFNTADLYNNSKKINEFVSGFIDRL